MSDSPSHVRTAIFRATPAGHARQTGKAWIGRRLPDPAAEAARAECPVRLNESIRYVTPETLRALQDEIQAETPPSLVLDGADVTFVDLAPDGQNLDIVPASRGRTQWRKPDAPPAG